jgi:hypothetical protein
VTTPGVLDEEHIVHFKTNGFLILCRVLDPGLLARARARLWDAALTSIWRDNPEGWNGPIPIAEEDEGRDNYRKGFRWQYRAIGTDDWMVALLPKDPCVWHVAQ